MQTHILIPRLFEFVNGALFVVCLSLCVIFAQYLCRLYRESSSFGMFYYEARPAIAMLVVFLGDAIIRGPVWFFRWGDRLNIVDPKPWSAMFITTILLGVGIAAFGGWCVARVFGRPKAGLYTMIAALSLSLLFSMPW